MAKRSNSLKTRVQERKRNSFEGIPKSKVKAIAERTKSIAENGIAAHEAMEYAEELHNADVINNDILESGLI